MKAEINSILSLITKKEKINLFFLFLSMFTLALFEMAGIASIMPFMAMVADPNTFMNTKIVKQIYVFFNFTSEYKFLYFLGIFVLLLLVLSNFLRGITNWLMLKFSNNLYFKIAYRLLEKYLSEPYVFFLNRNTSEMGKNVLEEVRNAVAGVIGPCLQVISSFLLSLFILALLLVIDPLIACSIAFILGGSYFIIYSFVRKKLLTIGEGQVYENSKKFKIASEALNGIKELKILGNEKYYLEQFAIHASRHAEYNTTAGVISQVPRYGLEVVAFGGILLIVLYFLGSEQNVGNMIPLLALYAFSGYKLLPALQQIFASVTTIRYNIAAINVIDQDMKNRCNNCTDKNSLFNLYDDNFIFSKNNIELKNITFFYPGKSCPALDNVSLSIKEKSIVGFVGATGSGKTTIVDCILGLLSPSIGSIVIDNTVLSSDIIKKWQRNIGYVSQQIFLSDDTILRNIALGLQDSNIDKNSVIRAAQLANLHDFIEKELPESYQTVIGDRGVRLSGGQRQRIGIARALYRDPAVLILDEATSALDGVTEEAVMEAIQSLTRKKTIIIIAHRLTTLQDCDVIYHLKNGKIVEFGTYEYLYKTSEWFQSAARVGVLTSKD